MIKTGHSISEPLTRYVLRTFFLLRGKNRLGIAHYMPAEGICSKNQTRKIITKVFMLLHKQIYKANAKASMPSANEVIDTVTDEAAPV